MRIKKKPKIFFMLLLLVVTLTGCASEPSSPEAELGLLDLSQWNLSAHGTLQLDGEWAFYQNELLSYQALLNRGENCFIRVPGTWDSDVSGTTSSSEGFATYRLTVKSGLPKGTLLGIHLQTVSSAYRLYVNDQQIASAGIVGTSPTEETGAYQPQTVFFSSPDEQFDLIIQVSNFHYARGGLWESISFGTSSQIQQESQQAQFKEAFLLGLLFIITVFYLATFFMLKELRYTVYSSLVCIAGALAIDTVGEFILISPVLPFSVVVGTWYSSTNWLVFLILLLMHELYPSPFSCIVVKLNLILSSIIQIAVIVLPSSLYSKFAFVTNFNEGASLILAIIIIMIGAQIGHQKWLLNLLSIVIFCISYIHDIFYFTIPSYVKHGSLFFLGVSLGLSLQIIAQAQHIKNYFNQKNSAELLHLQAQMKPHFIYNTINTVISISRFDGEKARSLLLDFSQYLRKSFDFKAEHQMVALSDEIALARAYLSIEQARFGDRLTVSFDVPPDIMDQKVPILMLQPIIENAVIHGILPKTEGGNIDIQIRQEANRLHFTVQDTGVGMPQREADAFLLLTIHHVGLSNIHSRLRRLYRKGGLSIQSTIDCGTSVNWSIPI